MYNFYKKKRYEGSTGSTGSEAVLVGFKRFKHYIVEHVHIFIIQTEPDF